MKICIVENCENVQHCRNYCNSHYLRFWKYGDPLAGKEFQRKRGMTLQEYVNWCFLQTKLGGPNGDCWVWQKSVDTYGYPQSKFNGKNKLVGKLILLELYGEQIGKIMRHSCDNRACINPDHISYGTMYENTIDTLNRGPRCKTRKLWPKQVIEIRNLIEQGERNVTIAERFGVAPNTISQIRTGDHWSHVPT